MTAMWHVIHKPTGKTLCGQPNDGTKPAEGEPCNGCATAMYDVFGEVLDELEAERAKVARVKSVVTARPELTVTQYRDPITSEARTVTTCPEHTARMLRVLHAAGVGCGSTYSPSFDCDPCKNEKENPTP